MKECDLNAVYTEVQTQLNDQDWRILDYLTRDQATLVVCNIYNTNDSAKGFGQDFEDCISIISSRQRISAIASGAHSFYKSETPLCIYVDLADDVHQILIVMEAAIQRMETFL